MKPMKVIINGKEVLLKNLVLPSNIKTLSNASQPSSQQVLPLSSKVKVLIQPTQAAPINKVHSQSGPPNNQPTQAASVQAQKNPQQQSKETNGRQKRKVGEWTETQTLELIQAVQEFPCVYQTTSPDYKDTDKRSKAYELIERHVKAFKPKVDGDEVRAKWQSLRNQFLKEWNKTLAASQTGIGTDSTYKTQMKYFHQLLFLKESATQRKTVTNLSTTINESTTVDESTTIDESTTVDESTTIDDLIHEEELMDSGPSSVPSPAKKKKRNPGKKSPRKDSDAGIEKVFTEAVKVMSTIGNRSRDKPNKKYETFCAYVADRMSKFPPEVANRVESQILSLLSQNSD